MEAWDRPHQHYVLWHPLGVVPGGFAYLTPYLFASGTTGAPLGLPFPVTPLLLTNARWFRNDDLMSYRLRISAST